MKNLVVIRLLTTMTVSRGLFCPILAEVSLRTVSRPANSLTFT